MLRKGTLHERETEPLGDGTYSAVTMIDAPPHGILVWAGHLSPSALDKPAEQIQAEDYVVRQTINFMAWEHVWSYFAGSQYEDLARRHRASVESLYCTAKD